jgi:hydroxyacylglutathione hydrolase
MAFGGAHVPGAINVGRGPSLPTWVGWLLPPDAPLILVLEQQEDWTETVTALARVGYEQVVGYLMGGMASWAEAALPMAQVPQWSVEALRERLASDGQQVLDVRTDAEWEAGHIDGATHCPLPDLPTRVDDFPRGRTTAVICGTGYRSSIATSLLARQGFANVVNVLGGMIAWDAAKSDRQSAGASPWPRRRGERVG